MNKENSVEVEKPILDLQFQKGLLKLAIDQDYYCGQLVKFLYDDKDLAKKKAFVFSHPTLTKLFLIIGKIYNDLGTKPEMGTLRQRINETKNPKERQELYDLLANLESMNVFNDKAYKSFITAFVKEVKLVKALKKSNELLVGQTKDESISADDYLRVALDEITKVSFEQDDVVTLDDIPQILKDIVSENSRVLPTGIPELDKDLLGGMPSEALVLAVGGTNVGKSIFCISLACNVLRATNSQGISMGHKVLHINLEGQRTEAILRYTSNLANVRYRSLLEQSYSKEEYNHIMQTMNDYSGRLRVRNMLGFGKTIEELVAVVREEHKTFKFDMLVVDYGQLLRTQNRNAEHRLVMADVHRGLDALAKELRCVCLTPVQATRGAQASQNDFKKRGNEDPKAPVLRSEDISESFELARVAEIIFTLNITDEEREEGKYRVFLEKQRKGIKGRTYGLLTDFPRMNLIKQSYDCNAVMRENVEDERIKNETFTPDSFIDGGSEETQEFKEEIDKTVEKFHSKKALYAETKKKYETLRESEEADDDELDKVFDKVVYLKDELIELMRKAAPELKAVYPDASEAEYEELLSKLRELRAEGNVSEIEETEQIIKRYKLGLQKERIPK